MSRRTTFAARSRQVVAGTRQVGGSRRHDPASAAFRRSITGDGRGVDAAARSRGSTLVRSPDHDERQQPRERRASRAQHLLARRRRRRGRCRSESGNRGGSCGSLAVVTERHHEEPLAERRRPSHDLVVVELATSRTRTPAPSPFSFIWVFHRAAATAPMPSAPQMTGKRSPIQVASVFAGLSLGGTVGPELREHGRSSSPTASSTSRAERGEQPHRLERAERGERQVAERRAGLIAGRAPRTVATPAAGSLVARSCPPRSPTSTRQPRSQRLDERGERLRRVPGVRRGHHQRMRAAVLGQHRRAVHLDREGRDARRTRDRTTSPDDRRSAHTAERHGRDVLARTGDRSASARRVVGRAAIVRQAAHGVEHALRIAPDAAPADRRDRSPLASTLLAGFSASSISITGMSSRTGYRYPHVRHTMTCCVLEVVDLAAVVRAHQDLQQLGIDRHDRLLLLGSARGPSPSSPAGARRSWPRRSGAGAAPCSTAARCTTSRRTLPSARRGGPVARPRSAPAISSIFAVRVAHRRVDLARGRVPAERREQLGQRHVRLRQLRRATTTAAISPESAR